MSQRLLLVGTVAVIASLACHPDRLAQPESPALAARAAVLSGSTGYDAIDLGTLGAQWVRPGAIDQQGRVWAYGPSADGRIHVFRWDAGAITDLGALPGLQSLSFSAGGLAAGSACSSTVEGCEPPVTFYVFDAGVLTPLETGATALAESWVTDVVDPSTVLGAVQYSSGRRVVVWQNGVREEMSPLHPTDFYTVGLDINTRGQVVGQSLDANFISRAVLWDNGTARDLGSLSDGLCGPDPQSGCGWTDAVALNDRGDIVGSSSIGSSNPGLQRAVIWRNGGPPEELGAFPGEYTQGALINNRGQVIGYGPGGWFLWDQGAVQPGASLGGAYTLVHDWNDRGEVVGWSLDAAGSPHAYVWRDGRTTDLGGAQPGDVWFAARYINERGDILGAYVTADNQERLILWTPKNDGASAVAHTP